MDVKVLAPWIVGASVVMFVASLAVIPWVIVSLPPDYFVRKTARLGPLANRHPVIRITLLVVKNGLGLVFLGLGFVMLFMPGQGVLSIFIGICLLDIPGKRALERKILARPGIMRTLNRIRNRFGKPSFIVPDHPDDAHAETPAADRQIV